MEYSNFFKLLLENNKDEIIDFLLSKGKGPKPVCPIMFINKKENEDDRIRKNN